MQTLNVIQNSPEWLAERANKFTASEASAMMGDSKYMSRDELLRQKKTGESKEITPAVQRLFDQGHKTEDMARPIAERIIGEELYPITGVSGKYLASFDGITMLQDLIFEHKLYNKTLALDIEIGHLSPHHYWQLEHQLMVSGADAVFFATSDGTPEKFVYMHYESRPERRKQLIAGWEQFGKDLDAYEVIDSPVKPEAAPIEALPAISYELNGLALTSNLDMYRASAEKLVDDSKKPMATDQDFADRESLVKKFKEAEGKIKLVQEQVVGEIKDVDTFCKELGYIGELIRQARLTGEKAVKSRKDEIKREIVQNAVDKVVDFIMDLNKTLLSHGIMMPEDRDYYQNSFINAAKGKKTVKSITEAVNDALAKIKISAGDQFSRIESNLVEYKSLADNFEFLFADLQQLILHPEDSFVALVKSRITDHKEAEAKRAEEEKAKQEEQKLVMTTVNSEGSIESTPLDDPIKIAHQLDGKVEPRVIQAAISEEEPVILNAIEIWANDFDISEDAKSALLETLRNNGLNI